MIPCFRTWQSDPGPQEFRKGQSEFRTQGSIGVLYEVRLDVNHHFVVALAVVRSLVAIRRNADGFLQDDEEQGE
jgi:hypothetical protein